MAVRAAILGLQQAVVRVERQLGTVTRTTEDHPDTGATVVVDLVHEACEDLRGWLADVAETTQGVVVAAEHRDLARLTERLPEVTGGSNRLVEHFITGLAGVESITRLRELARDRPGAWAAWSGQVQEDVAQAWPHVWALRSQLDLCWQEVVERLQDEPVLVRAQVETTGAAGDDAPAGGR